MWPFIQGVPIRTDFKKLNNKNIVAVFKVIFAIYKSTITRLKHSKKLNTNPAKGLQRWLI